MKRILIGLIVVAVVAAGGWLGFNFYVQHRATAQRQHPRVPGQRRTDRLALQLPEAGLAVVDEDLGDAAPGRGLDVLVGVAQVDAPALGEQRADGRLAGAHRPDQDHPGSAHENLNEDR